VSNSRDSPFDDPELHENYHLIIHQMKKTVHAMSFHWIIRSWKKLAFQFHRTNQSNPWIPIPFASRSFQKSFHTIEIVQKILDQEACFLSSNISFYEFSPMVEGNILKDYLFLKNSKFIFQLQF
jgi:hypothetical protein